MTFAIDSSRAAFKPTYKTEDAIGFDICSNNLDFIIPPMDCAVVDTGLFVDLKYTNGYHELQIRSRSGLAAKHSVFVLNSPGTIDPQFPEEIKVILFNAGKSPVTIRKGDRIAQGVVAECAPRALGVGVEDTVRTGGIGSTGV